MEDRHYLSDPRPVPGRPVPTWDVDVIREGVVPPIMTITVDKSVLPPRKGKGKNKKGGGTTVAWRLPDSADVLPKFGTQDVQRIMDIFRERKKELKRLKKRSSTAAAGDASGCLAEEEPDSKEAAAAEAEGAAELPCDAPGTVAASANTESLPPGFQRLSLSNGTTTADRKNDHHPSSPNERGGNGQTSGEQTHTGPSRHPQQQPTPTPPPPPPGLAVGPPPGLSSPPPGLSSPPPGFASIVAPSPMPALAAPRLQEPPSARQPHFSLPEGQPSPQIQSHSLPSAAATCPLPPPPPGAGGRCFILPVSPAFKDGDDASSAVPIGRHVAEAYYLLLSRGLVEELASHYTPHAEKSLTVGGAHASCGRSPPDRILQLRSVACLDPPPRIKGVQQQPTAGGATLVLITGVSSHQSLRHQRHDNNNNGGGGGGAVLLPFCHSLVLVPVPVATSATEPSAAAAAAVGYQILNDNLVFLTGDEEPTTPAGNNNHNGMSGNHNHGNGISSYHGNGISNRNGHGNGYFHRPPHPMNGGTSAAGMMM